MGPEKGGGMPPAIFYGQSTSTDLGAMAQRAGVKYYMLTHLTPLLDPPYHSVRRVFPSTACLPSLLTTNGMLIGISTGYRRAGLLYAKHRDHFGEDTPDVLVVQGSSRTFNATLSETGIAAMRAADPTAHASEWDAEFRSDLSAFLDDELSAPSTTTGRPSCRQ
jgi:hypothetical protein